MEEPRPITARTSSDSASTSTLRYTRMNGHHENGHGRNINGGDEDVEVVDFEPRRLSTSSRASSVASDDLDPYRAVRDIRPVEKSDIRGKTSMNVPRGTVRSLRGMLYLIARSTTTLSRQDSALRLLKSVLLLAKVSFQRHPHLIINY